MSLKIMVVDDEPLSSKVMRALAVPLGHKLLSLTDSQEAKQQAQKQHFNAFFVGMPRTDGLELVRQIRSVKPESDTAIVMLQMGDDIEALRNAFAAGATFVVPKPIVSARVIPMLTAMDSPAWKTSRHAARLPLFTQVSCKWEDRELPSRSLNISETGMLLETWRGAEVGREVSLQFQLNESQAPLQLRARIVRKDAERVGVEFVGLAPEHQNAIQLYVMGCLRETPRRGGAGTGSVV